MRFATVVLVALVLAAAAAAARPAAFQGNVCASVSKAKVVAIKGVVARCTNAPASAGPGSKIYVGNWAGKTPKSPTVQVTIARYTDAGALVLARRNLEQGLPGGTPKRVKGIGSAAYEATAAHAIGIHFQVDKYIVYVSLNAVGSKPNAASRTALEALAKSVASRLS